MLTKYYAIFATNNNCRPWITPRIYFMIQVNISISIYAIFATNNNSRLSITPRLMNMEALAFVNYASHRQITRAN